MRQYVLPGLKIELKCRTLGGRLAKYEKTTLIESTIIVIRRWLQQ